MPLISLIALTSLVRQLTIDDATSFKSYDDLVADYRPMVLESAARHNTLSGIPDTKFADWMMAIIATEMGGGQVLDNPLAWLGYPLWQGLKILGNQLGMDHSVGLAQIRPETAAQLMQGWFPHQDMAIPHNVKVAYSVSNTKAGSYGISPAELAKAHVSIEYLAANMEMGASVARFFGVEPSLEDLARWHNTGVGSWDEDMDEQMWAKGAIYVERVTKELEHLNYLVYASKSYATIPLVFESPRELD